MPSRISKHQVHPMTVEARLRAAYLDLCERQVAKLQHEIAITRATGDDTLEDLVAEADRLAQKIKARKALKPRRPAVREDGFED